jgi:hypothetical protein
MFQFRTNTQITQITQTRTCCCAAVQEVLKHDAATDVLPKPRSSVHQLAPCTPATDQQQTKSSSSVECAVDVLAKLRSDVHQLTPEDISATNNEHGS